jgi:hypothetical protein
MDSTVVQSFFDLGVTDRARWIALFCDKGPLASPWPSLVFPLLPHGESPLSWLEDQFRQAEIVVGKADRLREAVVDLLVRDLAGIDLRDTGQVLGTLVDLANSCSFTEIGGKVRDWLRGDRFASAVYSVDKHMIPLRQTLWSTAIAWGLGEEMRPFLKRDLGRPELDCGALCFSALGRLSPFDAILEIPSTFNWPRPYRDEVLRSFFEDFLGSTSSLIEPALLPAWERCLGELRWNPEVSELFQPWAESFYKLLSDAGLELSKLPGEEKFSLCSWEHGFSALLVDLEPNKRQLDERIVRYCRELLSGPLANQAGWRDPVYGTY